MDLDVFSMKNAFSTCYMAHQNSLLLPLKHQASKAAQVLIS